MKHEISREDERFREEFEACTATPAQFDHRAHLRLAYIYLAENTPEAASARMRESLLRFLRHHGIGSSKYHETLTRAWILAVRHFMASSPPTPSADAFIAGNLALLDREIMLTHYSAERLFSEEARGAFVKPDIAPFPRHEP